jgi:hypothetical protein
MQLDNAPVFAKWIHRNNIASIDRPRHWQVVEDQTQNLLVSFQPPDSPHINFSLATAPCQVTEAARDDESQLQQDLKALLSEARVDQHLGPCRLLCYPSHSVQLADGSFACAAVHHDQIVMITTHCPPGEQHIYQPIFERMLSSFRIDRRQYGRLAALRSQVISEFRRLAPETDCQPANDHIKFGQMHIFVDNLLSEIDQQPHRQTELIDHFIQTALQFANNPPQLGHETWDDIKTTLFPMVRPDTILHATQEAAGLNAAPPEQLQQIVAAPWLANLVTCYAIDTPKTLRFILHADLQRWGVTPSELHLQAMQNLQQSTNPEIIGAPAPHGGLDVGLPSVGPKTVKSAWILHPQLYQIVRSQFRGRIWAGIPNRDTIVLFAADIHNRNILLQKLHEDFRTSHHSISDRLFEITPDGIILV